MTGLAGQDLWKRDSTSLECTWYCTDVLLTVNLMAIMKHE